MGLRLFFTPFLSSPPFKLIHSVLFLYLLGLNQLALCEDGGFETPREVVWDDEEDPLLVVAGKSDYLAVAVNFYLNSK